MIYTRVALRRELESVQDKANLNKMSEKKEEWLASQEHGSVFHVGCGTGQWAAIKKLLLRIQPVSPTFQVSAKFTKMLSRFCRASSNISCQLAVWGGNHTKCGSFIGF